MTDILIKNGLLITDDGPLQADLAIAGERISALGAPGSLGSAAEEIDATGKWLLPGLIDPHVHLKHPFKSQYALDDFYTASVSAAYGGTTTLIDFAIQWNKELDLVATVENRLQQAAGEMVVDYAFHPCATVSCPETLEAIPKLITRGLPSFKLYMTYSRQGRMADDGLLYHALQIAGQEGGMVGVHAENDALIVFKEEEFQKKGLTSAAYFPIAKENMIEAEAINRVIYLNRSAKGNLYIFHLSTREGLELLKEAQKDGQSILAETCAHYLTLDDSYYSREDGINFLCSPPLRSLEDQAQLWGGLRSGHIQVVSSDHCGFGLEQKASGGGNFIQTPNGLPSLELRLPLLYTHGVLAGRIDAATMVRVLSSNSARIFGLRDKGALTPGKYADVVVMDPTREQVISTETLHSPVDWTPFAGMKLKGFAETVLSRGQVVVADQALKARKGQGRFVERKL